MKKLQNYLLLAIMLFGNAIAALASNYGDVFKNTRSDFRDESIYFVMTTRFFDGDESNNTHSVGKTSLPTKTILLGVATLKV